MEIHKDFNGFQWEMERDEGIFTKTDLTLRSGGVRRSSWAHLFCIFDVLSIYERFGTIAMVPGDENLKKTQKILDFPQKGRTLGFPYIDQPGTPL